MALNKRELAIHGNISFVTIRDNKGSIQVVAKAGHAQMMYEKNSLHSNHIRQ